MTGEEYRENEEDTDTEEEKVDAGEVEDEGMVSEEEDGDEDESESEPREREEDGVQARPAQSDPGDDSRIPEFENGRWSTDNEHAPDGSGSASSAGLQGENSPPSRPSSSFSRLSRSPPRSRSPSPDTLAKMTAALSLRAADVRERVAADLAKRQRQQKKYHTKRGAQRVGRPQGSKAKLDQRVKLDRGGIWG